MKKQQALAKVQSIVDKEGGFVRLPEPLTITVWFAGKETEVKINAIVDMVKDVYLDEDDNEVVNRELFAISEDYTAWNIDDFLNGQQMTTLADKLGGLTDKFDEAY